MTRALSSFSQSEQRAWLGLIRLARATRDPAASPQRLAASPRRVECATTGPVALGSPPPEWLPSSLRASTASRARSEAREQEAMKRCLNCHGHGFTWSEVGCDQCRSCGGSGRVSLWTWLRQKLALRMGRVLW